MASRSRATARATRSAAENAKMVRKLQRELKEREAASGDTTKFKAERAAWERERALLKRGITEDDDIAVVSALYDRLPPKDRPSLDEWLGSHAKEPDKAPKSLRPFLAEESKVPAKPPTKGSPPPRSRPAEASPSAGGGVTTEAIRAAGERARREGTPEAFNAYKALCAQLEAERSGG